MSHTTQIVLHVSPLDHDRAVDVAFWIRNQAPRSDHRTQAPPGHLAPITGEMGAEIWGGEKNPSAELWAGTTNHLDLDALLAHLARVNWEEPDAVQLLVKDEADPYFRLYMIRHGSLNQYSPAPPLEEQEIPW